MCSFVAARQEIRQTHKNHGGIASMDCLLIHLESSDHPQKWEKFVVALEKNGWFNHDIGKSHHI